MRVPFSFSFFSETLRVGVCESLNESEIESLKVCALSAVGTRAVLELHELGYRLVFKISFADGQVPRWIKKRGYSSSPSSSTPFCCSTVALDVGIWNLKN